MVFDCTIQNDSLIKEKISDDTYSSLYPEILLKYHPIQNLDHEEQYIIIKNDDENNIYFFQLAQGVYNKVTSNAGYVWKIIVEMYNGTLLFVHNHPNNVARPSAADIKSAQHVSDLCHAMLEICRFGGAYIYCDNEYVDVLSGGRFDYQGW